MVLREVGMSMEVYVLSGDQLESIGAWQRAIDARGFPLRLSTERIFADLRGALPAVIDGKSTAF
jgi:hypothetical protein